MSGGHKGVYFPATPGTVAVHVTAGGGWLHRAAGPSEPQCRPAGSRPAAVPASLAKPLARPHAPALGGKRWNPLRRPVSPAVPAAPGPAPPPPIRFLDPGDHEAAFAASGFNIHTHQSMCIYLTGLAQPAGICQNETIILHFTAVTSSGHISRI